MQSANPPHLHIQCPAVGPHNGCHGHHVRALQEAMKYGEANSAFVILPFFIFCAIMQKSTSQSMDHFGSILMESV